MAALWLSVWYRLRSGNVLVSAPSTGCIRKLAKLRRRRSGPLWRPGQVRAAACRRRPFGGRSARDSSTPPAAQAIQRWTLAPHLLPVHRLTKTNQPRSAGDGDEAASHQQCSSWAFPVHSEGGEGIDFAHCSLRGVPHVDVVDQWTDTRALVRAVVRPLLTVLDVPAAVAGLAARAQQGVEGIQGLRVEPAQRELAEHRSDVLVDRPPVPGPRRYRDGHHLQVSVHELVDRGVGTRVTPLVDLVL
jgi:hypothetical protein